MMITSLQNDLIKYFVKLKEKKYRIEYGQYLVEGLHLVNEALDAKCVEQIISTNPLDYPGIETILVSEEVMAKISDVKTPQGIMAVCKMSVTEDTLGDVLLLDHLQDPGNLGTIIRSAIGFGFSTIVLEESVDIYNSKVIRASQGGIFKIHFVSEPLDVFMKKHPEIHYVATNVKNATPLKKVNRPNKRVGILIGNEATGLNELYQSMANETVTIEMSQMESLNAAIAASILMYEYNQMKGLK